MTDRAFIDIDAAFAEQDVEASAPIVVRLAGVDWTLPGVLSAAAVVRISRWQEAGRELDELNVGETMALLGDLVPDHVLTAWTEAGIGIEDPRLSAAVVAIVEEQAKRLLAIGGAEGNFLAPVAATASGASSHSGRSSKPTSSESTDSPYQVL